MAITRNLFSESQVSERAVGPMAYAPETILTRDQLAAWLQVSGDMVDAMGFRCITISERKRRYLVKHILEDLDKRAAA